MNTRNGGIVIKNFTFDSGVKGAICQTYMHELGNFLIMHDCQTIEDHFKTSSETKNLSNKAGITTDKKKFGSIIRTITISAADYIDLIKGVRVLGC